MLLHPRGSAEVAGSSSPQSPRRDGLEALDAIAERQQVEEELRRARDAEALALAKELVDFFEGPGRLTKKVARQLAERTRRLDGLVARLREQT